MVVAAGVRVVKTLCRAFGTAVGNAAGLLGRGEDHRGAIAPTPPHTIFAETTLAPEECDAAVLSHVLWPLCEPGRLEAAIGATCGQLGRKLGRVWQRLQRRDKGN